MGQLEFGKRNLICSRYFPSRYLYMIIFYVGYNIPAVTTFTAIRVHLEFIALKQTTVRVCLLNDCLINIVYLKQQKKKNYLRIFARTTKNC